MRYQAANALPNSRIHPTYADPATPVDRLSPTCWGLGVALHARTAKRQRILDANTRQQLPLRVVLFVLALVPSVAMTALWAVNSNRLYDNWHTVSNHNTQTVRYATPVFAIFYGLQAERHLSAAALVDP